jgi:predicted phage tail protein
MKHLLEDTITEGAGGGGKSGGGGGGSESNDTLITDEIVKVLNLLGEGEVNLYTGDGQSIFLNSVPLVNSNGSYNFGNFNQTTGTSGLYVGGGATYWEYRNGSPSQTPMTNPAFPSASSVISVNQQFTGGTTVPLVAPAPVIYSVSAANVDYCKVAIQFPNGLENLDSNGNIIGDSVEIAIDVKPHSSSTWVNVIDRFVNDKSSTAAVIQFQVSNPSPGNLWDIRCRRITPENASSTRKNQTFLYTVEEVQQVTLPYNGIAYCGLALDARTIGGANASIPVMSFLVQRGPIQIPSNYNPATWTFTGLWDGTFTTGVTDDPAWILYDLLTNAQYGCGLYGITPSMVDKYSFYNASVFNNTLVPSGVTGVTEPRFTFNAALQNRQDMLVTLNQVAGMMNATLGQTSGLIELFQDRPDTARYLVNKANVIPSDKSGSVYFTYKSTAQTNRTTAVNVTWTNAQDPRYLPKTSSVTDSSGLARYGYQPYNLAAFGATTEGQAIRAGRYWLYQNLLCTEEVEFNVGLPGLLYNINDVFDLFDDDYAATSVSGRVVSATTNTITFDQPITITGTGSKVGVLLQDGVTYETHSISTTAGTYSTVTIAGNWSVIPTQYCVYGVTSAAAPRQFKMVDLKVDGVTKIVTCTAQLYNAGNYTYVNTGIAIPTPTYTLPQQVAPLAPTGLTATPTQYINPVNQQLTYGVTLTWTPPASQNIAFIVKWRKDNGQYNTEPQTRTSSFELPNIVDGAYNFLIYSVNLVGNVSAPATISYTLNTTGGSASTTLTEITNLSVMGGGTAWTSEDLSITFTNPTANQGLLKDFVVTFKTTGGTLLRQVIVPAVIGGQAQTYVYTWAMNQADGGPNRSIAVTVQGRDSQNNKTTGITATLTNAAPPVPSNISATPSDKAAIITWTPETGTDIAGYLVWHSTTSGFTPSSSNVTDCGMTAIASFNALTRTTNYYYIVAAYDVFGKSLSGTGLNLSSQLSFTTPSTAGISSGPTLPTSGMANGDLFYDTTNNTLYTFNGTSWIASGTSSGSSLPATGTLGQLFFNTSNNTLYQWSGSAWAPVGILSVSSLPASGTTGQVVFLTTDSKLYRWNGTSWVSSVAATDVTGTLTAAQIASLTAAQITGTLTASQIASLTTAQLTGTLTTTQIGANTIQTGNIAAAAVTTSQIAANTIVAGNIAAGTITGTTIAAGTITGSNLVANTITASQIAALTITGAQIAAATITGSNIAANTITAGLILAGTITTSQIASATITGGNIAAGTIAAANITSGTITTSQIAAGTITGSNIAGATITAGNMVAGTLTASTIASGAITTTQIAAGTITGGNIAGGTITGSNIVGGTITGSLVAANTITASNLSVSTLSAITANVGTLTAGTISNNSGTNTINLSATGGSYFINTPGFTVTAAGAAYFAGTLAANTVTTGNIVTGNITTSTINNGAVSGLALANQTSTYNFTATSGVAAYYDNANCTVTFTLAYATTVYITAYNEVDLNNGTSWTLGNFGSGALSFNVISLGGGETDAYGYIKVDSTYYTNTNGTFAPYLAAGSHTVKLAAYVDTTTSATATTSRMVNGQIAVQWNYR